MSAVMFAHLYVYTCKYRFIHMCIRLYVQNNLCKRHMCTFINLYVCMFTRISVLSYVLYTCTHVHSFVYNYVFTYVCLHLHMYVYAYSKLSAIWYVCLHVYLCMSMMYVTFEIHICTLVCTLVYVHLCLYIIMCTYVLMSTCMCTFMCVCI